MKKAGMDTQNKTFKFKIFKRYIGSWLKDIRDL